MVHRTCTVIEGGLGVVGGDWNYNCIRMKRASTAWSTHSPENATYTLLDIRAMCPAVEFSGTHLKPNDLPKWESSATKCILRKTSVFVVGVVRTGCVTWCRIDTSVNRAYIHLQCSIIIGTQCRGNIFCDWGDVDAGRVCTCASSQFAQQHDCRLYDSNCVQIVCINAIIVWNTIYIWIRIHQSPYCVYEIESHISTLYDCKANIRLIDSMCIISCAIV